MPKCVFKIPFVKIHGLGNDYVYLDLTKEDNLDFINEKRWSDLSKKISDRHFGVGSDGLILILPSEKADFQMRILNADGSEAQMCGNGIRCVAKYVFDCNLTQKTNLRIETLAGVKEIDLFVQDRQVKSIRVDMGEPLLEPGLIPVKGEKRGDFYKQTVRVKDRSFDFTAIGMGNPHCVIFVDELTDELVHKYGPLIECNPIFPEKTNVEFIKVLGKSKLEMRVWERGSGETLACGTGACASAVATWLNGFTENKIDIKLLGGDLKVEIDKKTNHVFMTGGAEFICEGTYFYEADL